MDQLLKEFELLSLPSRVNLEAISDDCIDKHLEKVDFKRVFEALKAKGDNATSFQWRKLREALLISKRNCCDLLIQVYEEAVLFNLRKSEMAECHISISKLLDFYNEKRKYNHEFLAIIILFRFYYTNEGLAEVSTILRQKIPLDSLKDPSIKFALRVCKLASEGNYWMIKKLRSDERVNRDLLTLIDLICESCKNVFISNIIRAYPIVSVSWMRTLLHTDEPPDSLKGLLESFSHDKNVDLSENGDKFKFVLKKKK